MITLQTVLTNESAKRIMELGKSLHGESQFNAEDFDDVKCWALLESTLTHPTKRFIAFDAEYRGFILMGINDHYFSNVKHAEDFCLFIVPEFRGGSLVVRLLNAAEKWAKENGARDITIHHNTGINTAKAPTLFNKLGYDMGGYIFTKDLTNV